MNEIFASSTDRVGWRYLNDKIGGFPYNEGMWTICRRVDGEIVGAAGYTDFTGSACAFHIASSHKRFISKDFLWKIFHVPFQQWGLEVMIATIASGNLPSLTFAKKLGFEEFAIVPRAHPDGALVFVRMFRENCRWLKLPERKLT